MIGSMIGFIELGGIILAWMVFWMYLIRAFTAAHSNNVAAQGLAAVVTT